MGEPIDYIDAEKMLTKMEEIEKNLKQIEDTLGSISTLIDNQSSHIIEEIEKNLKQKEYSATLTAFD